MKRFNCYSAGCSICSKATLVENSILDGKVYLCDKTSIEHREISASSCKYFRCKKINNSNASACKNCNGGL